MRLYKYSLAALSLIGIVLLSPSVASAHTADNQTTTTTSSSTDEQKGQDIYAQLQSKQTSCDKLTDNDFDLLGDFFMGRMMGSAHDAIDQQMTQHLGADGERQTHIAMGERLSGCDTNASYPDSASNYAPMAWTGMMGDSNSLLSGSDMALWALFAIVVFAALIGWLYYRTRTTTTPLDTIKLRLAKGEITETEFKELKHGLAGK
ncbi:MAG: hypothetical protein ABI716_01400 [Candidatus Saccharibacteria bacterium]